jgi:hypothetical protein
MHTKADACPTMRIQAFTPFGRRGCDKTTRRADFRCRRRANHIYDSRHPVPGEGALAIVTNVGMGCGGRGGGVRAMGWQGGLSGLVSDHRTRGRAVPKRTVKSCGPDASAVGVKSAEGKSARPGADAPAIRRRRRQQGPILRGEREVSRKAIAQGMPECLR